MIMIAIKKTFFRRVEETFLFLTREFSLILAVDMCTMFPRIFVVIFIVLCSRKDAEARKRSYEKDEVVKKFLIIFKFIIILLNFRKNSSKLLVIKMKFMKLKLKIFINLKFIEFFLQKCPPKHFLQYFLCTDFLQTQLIF